MYGRKKTYALYLTIRTLLLGPLLCFRLQGAVKDNDFIYHEVVPELDALPEIKGKHTLQEQLTREIKERLTQKDKFVAWVTVVIFCQLYHFPVCKTPEIRP